jgi:integrase
MTPWTIWERFRKACELAGVPRIRVHDLRTTGLTLMGSGGVSDLILRDRAGHTSARTTHGYLNPAAEIQRVGAEVLAEMLGLGAEDIMIGERPAD